MTLTTYLLVVKNTWKARNHQKAHMQHLFFKGRDGRLGLVFQEGVIGGLRTPTSFRAVLQSQCKMHAGWDMKLNESYNEDI